MKLGDVNEGSLKNNNLYNDKELFDDADLNWYDYGFRSYDPQIGRFPQLDPLTDDYPELTPYQYASDEPIANVDMDGLEKYLSLEPVVIKATLKSAPQVTKALNAINLGINTFKIGAQIADNTSVSKNILKQNLEGAQILTGQQANIESNYVEPPYDPGSKVIRYRTNSTKNFCKSI